MIAHILVVIFLLFVAIGGFYSVRLFKKWLERKDSSFVISVMEVVIFWSSIVYLHQIKEQDIPSKVFIFVTTWIGLKTLNHPTHKEIRKQAHSRYRFLVITVLNIALGLFLGLLTIKLW
jgi:hypothetical protein